MSTECDKGETVCFENIKTEDGIKIRHTTELYDGKESPKDRPTKLFY